MHAGKLNQRIILQQYTPTQDSSGSVTEAWTTLATVWAAIRPLQGREYWAANQEQIEATHEVTIRWRRDVSSINRILFGSRIFDIKAAINTDEANKWLIMICMERD